MAPAYGYGVGYGHRRCGGGDPTLALHQNFLLDSAATMANAAVVGITLPFTRASQGTCFDETGVLVTKAVDEPRFDHDPVTPFSAFGLLPEEARTNEALHNQDLTDPAWVKSASMAAAKDATGIDGVANSASTLTASAANQTCLQTVTKASAENTYSVYIKRKTGTGDIQITDDNGVTWTTVTGLSSTAFTRYETTRTQANPVFGIRIVTSGDAVEVDYNQLEAGPFASSAIATTTAAVIRAADLCSTTDLSWWDDNAGTLYVQSKLRTFDQLCILAGFHTTSFNNGFTLVKSNAAANGDGNWMLGTTRDAASTVLKLSQTANSGLIHKAIITRNTSSFRGAADATAVVSGTARSPLPTRFFIGGRPGSTTLYTNGHIQVVKAWNGLKSDAFLDAEIA